MHFVDQAIEYSFALSQDLKITIYVSWHCSMLFFNVINVIPDWRQSFMFLNSPIEVRPGRCRHSFMPDIVHIAQTHTCSSTLLSWFDLVSDLSGLCTRGESRFLFCGLIPQVAFARNRPISDRWMVTLFWQALHLCYMLVWELIARTFLGHKITDHVDCSNPTHIVILRSWEIIRGKLFL